MSKNNKQNITRKIENIEYLEQKRKEMMRRWHKSGKEYIEDLIHANRSKIIRALEDIAEDILVENCEISRFGMTRADERKLDVARDYILGNYQD